MNLQAFEMDPNEARKAFLAYRDGFREEYENIDRELMRCYQAMSTGKRVIVLSDVLRAGGLHPDGYPKLAIARADWGLVYVWAREDGEMTFFPNRSHRSKGIYTPPGTFREGARYIPRWTSKAALVPHIPPQFRPRGMISSYHILFEADHWAENPPAPKDPALLKRLGDDLYAVIAVWDLTPLEQTVLGMARRPALR